jgi:hypothetical protein
MEISFSRNGKVPEPKMYIVESDLYFKVAEEEQLFILADDGTLVQSRFKSFDELREHFGYAQPVYEGDTVTIKV